MTDLPASGYMENAARTEAEMKQAFEDVRDFIEEQPGGEAEAELTISSGSVTPTAFAHTVDTEGDAGTDDLANIALTNHPDGRLLLLRAENASRVVTVKHAAGGDGQVYLASDADVDLDSVDKFLMLIRNGSAWYEVSLLQTVENFDSGTLMLFVQNAAATGWTRKTSGYTDTAMLCVALSGDIAAGGSVNPQSAHDHAVGTIDASDHTIAQANLPDCTFKIKVSNDDAGVSQTNGAGYLQANGALLGRDTSVGGSHLAEVVESGGSGTALAHSMSGSSADNTAPYYQETIICEKD